MVISRTDLCHIPPNTVLILIRKSVWYSVFQWVYYVFSLQVRYMSWVSWLAIRWCICHAWLFFKHNIFLWLNGTPSWAEYSLSRWIVYRIKDTLSIMALKMTQCMSNRLFPLCFNPVISSFASLRDFNKYFAVFLEASSRVYLKLDKSNWTDSSTGTLFHQEIIPCLDICKTQCGNQTLRLFWTSI